MVRVSARLLVLLTLVLGLGHLLAGCSSGMSSSGGASGGSSGGSSGGGSQVIAPSITTQPVDQSASVGGAATFTVVAGGTGPLTYEWRRGGVTIAGAVSASYTTAALTTADDGASFTVTVSNSAGSVLSNAAKLSVKAVSPQITAQPADTTVSAGADAKFSVTATGSPAPGYQWTRNGMAISGATGSTYTLTAAQKTDSGSTFAVVVTNSAGSVTSAAAKLTVTAAVPAIATQPLGATRFQGETATFTVAATGDSLSYQWRANGAVISGATAATYTTPALKLTDDKTVYDVVVTNTVGAVTSTTAALSVGPFATTYTTQKGAKLNLYAWPGTKNAVLTSSATLDPVIMRKYMASLDAAYNYYAKAVGKEPTLYFNYNGLATVAEVPSAADTCGAGCTYIGATGMEIADPYFYWGLWALPFNAYDQIPFYEFGRSFWLFPQLNFSSGADNSCFVTGFAVFMRVRSIAGLGLQGSINAFPTSATDSAAAARGIASYNTGVANTDGIIDTYAADSTLSFDNTFAVNKFTNPNGDCPVLFTSLGQRLARDYGGETFVQALWKEVLKRPTSTSTQTAADNFILAASAAANKNLTGVFHDTWKWPVSVAASTEAMNRWGKP